MKYYSIHKRPFLRQPNIGMLFLWLLSACNNQSALSEKTEDLPIAQSAANEFKGQFVKARPLQKVGSLHSPAHILAAPQAHYWLTPSFDGQVLSLEVQEGDVVKKGQKLLSLLIPSLAQAAAQLLTANEKISAISKEKHRLKKLQEAGMVKAANQARIEVDLAEANGVRRAALAALSSAHQTEHAALSLIKTGGVVSLFAPKSGVVQSISCAIGAPALKQNSLLEVTSQAPVKIQANLAPGLLNGDFKSFVFVFENSQKKKIPVQLQNYSPSANVVTGTQKAWFIFDENQDSSIEFLAGNTGYILPQDAEPLWVVPSQAILSKSSSQKTSLSENTKVTPLRQQIEVRIQGSIQTIDVIELASTEGLSIVKGIHKEIDVAIRKNREVHHEH